MRTRLLIGIVIAAVVLLLSPEAAGAHAAFVGAGGGVPTNSDVPLTMRVPHERDATTYNVDVLIALPSGWTALSCQSKATWTCAVGTVDGRQTMRFTKSPGAAVAEDETFVFTAHSAATVGSFSFPTVQTYNTTEVVRWIAEPGAPDQSRPAPSLQTFASTTAPSIPATTAPSATTVPTTSRSTAATGSSSTIATTTGSTTTAAAPSTTVDSGSDDDGGGIAAAIAVIVVVGAIAAGAGAWWWRRQSHSRLRNSA